jgi:hypothetical protein
MLAAGEVWSLPAIAVPALAFSARRHGAEKLSRCGDRGQTATPLVAPAIANAVAELAGVRLRHTPMTPDR